MTVREMREIGTIEAKAHLTRLLDAVGRGGR